MSHDSVIVFTVRGRCQPVKTGCCCCCCRSSRPRTYDVVWSRDQSPNSSRSVLLLSESRKWLSLESNQQ